MRDVNVSEAIRTVLATDQQLQDLKWLCSDPSAKDFSVLGVDPPSTWANCTLLPQHTNTNCWRHTKLASVQSSLGRSRCTCIGTQNHTSSLLLRRLCPELTGICGIGEEALKKGLHTDLPVAVKIQGTSHKHDSIKEKLRKLGVKENAARDITNDIFGHQIASTCYNGLIDGKEVSESSSDLTPDTWTLHTCTTNNVYTIGQYHHSCASTSTTNTDVTISHKAHANSQHTDPLTDGTKSPVAYTLKSIQRTTIRSCYGCGGAIRLNTASVSAPPHDVVTRYKERRHYGDPITKEIKHTTTAENTHHHFTLRCAQKKHPSLQPAQLVIPRDTLLSTAHVAHLLMSLVLHVTLNCS